MVTDRYECYPAIPRNFNSVIIRFAADVSQFLALGYRAVPIAQVRLPGSFEVLLNVLGHGQAH